MRGTGPRDRTVCNRGPAPYQTHATAYRHPRDGVPALPHPTALIQRGGLFLSPLRERVAREAGRARGARDPDRSPLSRLLRRHPPPQRGEGRSPLPQAFHPRLFPRGFTPARGSAPGAWPKSMRGRGRGTPRNPVLRFSGVPVPRRPGLRRRRRGRWRRGVSDGARAGAKFGGFWGDPARFGASLRRTPPRHGRRRSFFPLTQRRVGRRGHFLPRRAALCRAGGHSEPSPGAAATEATDAGTAPPPFSPPGRSPVRLPIRSGGRCGDRDTN
jgi:hypothetical protein